eukprot:2119006-Heterocapsa_arctica.AAC.1
MQAVTDQLLESGGRCLCFPWHARYDETPLKFRVADTMSLDTLEKAGVKLRGVCPIPGAFKDRVPHKVLQSQ